MDRRLLFERGLLWLGGALLVGFLLAPVLALFVSSSLGELATGLTHPSVGPALRLSLLTTTISLLIVVLFGTPLAWMLARSSGRVARATELLVQLPIVVQPAVAGVGLLFAFGRRGLLTGVLYPQSWALTFSTIAVVMAQTFVAAPFFIRSAQTGFANVPREMEEGASDLGADRWRVFRHITLPLAGPAILSGVILSGARALGEFGATILFAGNFAGRTQTMPLAIYQAMESDVGAALTLAALLVLISFLFLLALRWVTHGRIAHPML